MSGITVPLVPTEDALRAALAAPEGAQKLITDLYQIAAGTAQSLADHVGQSVDSHEDLEAQNARLAVELADIKKIAESSLGRVAEEVAKTQGVLEAQVTRVDAALAGAEARIADEVKSIKSVIEAQVKRIDGEEEHMKAVIDTQLARINTELDSVKSTVAAELGAMTVAIQRAEQAVQIVHSTAAPALAEDLKYMRGQIDVLKARGKEQKALAADERCKTLGSLGSGERGGAEYRKWTSTIVQMVDEHFGPSAKGMLFAAKAAGEARLTDGSGDLSVPDPIESSDQVEDLSSAVQVDRELYGLLLQQTAGNVWQALDNLRDLSWPGFNAWRVIHYGCNPKNPLKAEA